MGSVFVIGSFSTEPNYMSSLDAVAALPHRNHRRLANAFLSDNEGAPKRFNVLSKAPDKHWGETHQKFGVFIRQC